MATGLREACTRIDMMAKDEEMLRQSIGVESDVGRRQFHNVVAAMVGIVGDSVRGVTVPR